jgi:ABC-2 type transport system ATP-binding protein
MLAEVEQICDRVTIINRGRIVREGAVAELLAENTRLRLDAEPLDKARAVIAEHWQIAANGSGLLIDAQREDIPVIVRKLVEQQVNVYEITPQRQSLEEYFLAATQDAD